MYRGLRTGVSKKEEYWCLGCLEDFIRGVDILNMYRWLRVGVKVLHFSAQLVSNILGIFSWDPDLYQVSYPFFSFRSGSGSSFISAGRIRSI